LEDPGLINAAGVVRVNRAEEGISVEIRYVKSSASPFDSLETINEIKHLILRYFWVFFL